MAKLKKHKRSLSVGEMEKKTSRIQRSPCTERRAGSLKRAWYPGMGNLPDTKAELPQQRTLPITASLTHVEDNNYQLQEFGCKGETSNSSWTHRLRSLQESKKHLQVQHNFRMEIAVHWEEFLQQIYMVHIVTEMIRTRNLTLTK